VARLLGFVFVFILGVAAGAWAFRDVQPRTWIGVREKKVHASYQELLGYLGSAAMQRTPGVIPSVAIETDKTVAIRYPTRRSHFVVVPKRDIKDIGELARGDEPYLIDAFAVIGKLARDEHLEHYQVITNGPHEQTVRYLHFHVVQVDPVGTTYRADTLRTTARKKR
jgi:hypothetical protein